MLVGKIQEFHRCLQTSQEGMTIKMRRRSVSSTLVSHCLPPLYVITSETSPPGRHEAHPKLSQNATHKSKRRRLLLCTAKCCRQILHIFWMRSFLVIVYFFVTPGTPVKSHFIQIFFLARCSTTEIVFSAVQGCSLWQALWVMNLEVISAMAINFNYFTMRQTGFQFSERLASCSQ